MEIFNFITIKDLSYRLDQLQIHSSLFNYIKFKHSKYDLHEKDSLEISLLVKSSSLSLPLKHLQ